jgi:hypothetical protein
LFVVVYAGSDIGAAPQAVCSPDISK